MAEVRPDSASSSVALMAWILAGRAVWTLIAIQKFRNSSGKTKIFPEGSLLYEMEGASHLGKTKGSEPGQSYTPLIPGSLLHLKQSTSSLAQSEAIWLQFHHQYRIVLCSTIPLINSGYHHVDETAV